MEKQLATRRLKKKIWSSKGLLSAFLIPETLTIVAVTTVAFKR
jgi:hypothetical protein